MRYQCAHASRPPPEPRDERLASTGYHSYYPGNAFPRGVPGELKNTTRSSPRASQSANSEPTTSHLSSATLLALASAQVASDSDSERREGAYDKPSLFAKEGSRPRRPSTLRWALGPPNPYGSGTSLGLYSPRIVRYREPPLPNHPARAAALIACSPRAQPFDRQGAPPQV